MQILQIVGDAFARPLIDELTRNDYDLSNLIVVVNGGAPMNSSLKERLIDQLPNIMVLDAVGSSETGAQMGHTSTKGTASHRRVHARARAPWWSARRSTACSRRATVTSAGWPRRASCRSATSATRTKTARTFPTIDGVRYSVPGDRARWRADGIIELLGRDSVTINSGGEKIFAEEVEQAIAHHPAVYDVIVVGRPSERWGQEVVALVQTGRGRDGDRRRAAGRVRQAHRPLQVPQGVHLPAELVRSPAGKADYRWAKDVAPSGSGARLMSWTGRRRPDP